jgi:hypothetical protein
MILQEMLAGPDPAEPMPPGVPLELGAAVTKAVDKDPAQRHASVADLLAIVKKYAPS